MTYQQRQMDINLTQEKEIKLNRTQIPAASTTTTTIVRVITWEISTCRPTTTITTTLPAWLCR